MRFSRLGTGSTSRKSPLLLAGFHPWLTGGFAYILFCDPSAQASESFGNSVRKSLATVEHLCLTLLRRITSDTAWTAVRHGSVNSFVVYLKLRSRQSKYPSAERQPLSTSPVA
ncbi:hypothetical protein BDV30DRAFT_99360 [Aspergillus minisclerotigenes]|uniref:Uncharacterized protein n=1 Tax=Aspergillus minisclerotigenes TaxID=656917 RepID=A0A5N6J4U6_9EURO|nr:hypothetical protein BDV30DRAFT_99360 [Aspergillus minisclerotigenes]